MSKTVSKAVSLDTGYKNYTLELLRNKYKFQEGDKVKTKDDNGKYINAVVKQRTGFMFLLSCSNGYRATVTLQDLAVDEDLIKGRD